MITAHVEAESALIVTEVDMLLSLEAVREHRLQLRAAIDTVRQKHSHFDMLIRTSGNTLPQAVADGIKGAIAQDKHLGVRKTAIILPGLVARLQMRRVSEGADHVQSFASEAEARAWLAQ